MKQQYIVQMSGQSNFFIIITFLRRVVSYNKNKYKVCLTQEYAHKYQDEKTASNAANRLGGKVILI